MASLSPDATGCVGPAVPREQDVQHVHGQEDPVRRAARALGDADFLLIATGAGVSADSGLATFQTLTAKMGPAFGKGITYDHAASVDTMAKDPALFYGFWLVSARNYREAVPHAGYDVLRALRLQTEERASKRRPLDSSPAQPTFCLTSNVDGWFSRKDVPCQGALAQIHGVHDRWQCGGTPSGKRFPTWAKDRCCDDLLDMPSGDGMDFDTIPLRYNAEPPRCPRCGDGWLRPNIYLFGDGSRFSNNEHVTGEAAFGGWCKQTIAALCGDSSLKLAVLEIGCGLRVPNIRKRGEELVAKSPPDQCEFIRMNIEDTSTIFHASPSIVVKLSALEGLQQIYHEMFAQPPAAPPMH